MDQNQALDILKMGHNVFLTGSPGSGKTFLLNRYIDYLKKHNKAVAITASTGIAATHMNGITLHSWSGIGIKDSISDTEVRALAKRKYLIKRIKATKVLIIDEVSMLKAGQFDAVEKICRMFKGSFLPFGGIQVICSGDFFQLPPIERNSDEVNFIADSRAWKELDIKTCYLSGQFRHKDVTLSDLLDSIRKNNIEKSKQILQASYTQNGIIANAVYTRLYTHNADVDQINNQELEKIEGKEFVYQMTSTGPIDIVDSLKKSCLSPETLVLKKGALVMFIKNNFEQGYVNGTQGTVVDFDVMGMPIIETLAGKKITVEKSVWNIEDENNFSIAQIRQLPLRLAWAITVHKSQGMNLDSAQIDLSKCFIKGMGYVALSRLKTFAGLSLIGINDLALQVNDKALEMDKKFKKGSEMVLSDFKALSFDHIGKQQKNFIN